MTRIGIVIADDQELFIEGLKAVIRSCAKEIDILATVHDGEAAVAAVAQHQPDVVLLDVRMPLLDGVEAAKLIHKRNKFTRIMMLTAFDDDEYVQNAIQNGAAAYILKDASPQEFVDAIRAIHIGAILISPRVAQRLVSRSNDRAEPEGGADEDMPDWVKSLSRRENEILRLIANGYGNPEIAESLCIAEQTVRNHVSIIYSKLGVHRRFDAMRKARSLTQEFSWALLRPGAEDHG